VATAPLSVITSIRKSLRAHPARWIIAVAVLARVPLLFTGLTYSSDIWRQADTASIAQNFWHGGYRLLFPQIDWGGAGPGYVEAEFQLYPFAVALLYRLLGGEHLWLGKLVSLGFTSGMLVAFWSLARRTVSRPAAVVALAFVAFSPISLRYGTAFMPDATALFFYVLALLLFVRWLAEDRSGLLVGAGGATALALLVKPTTVNVVLVLVVLLVHQRGWRALRSAKLWAVAVLAVVPVALWTLHARDLHRRYGNTFGVISGGDRKFASLDTFLSSTFYVGVTRTEVVWVFGVVSAPLFAWGLVVAVRRRGPTLLLAGAVTIPLFFAIVARCSAGPQGIQYHLFALPYAALGIGLGWESLAQWAATRSRPVRWAPAASAVLFVGVCGVFYLRLLPEQGQVYTSCADVVAAAVPNDDRIVVSSTYSSKDDGYDANFQEPMIFFYSGRRGWSLAADRHDPEHLDALRAEGARWFVMYDEGLSASSPAFMAYLARQSTQVGPGIAEQCGVWHLER